MFGKKSKEPKRIKSKAWLDLLTGETEEKAGTRVDDMSSINYSIQEKYTDEEGVERMREVK